MAALHPTEYSATLTEFANENTMPIDAPHAGPSVLATSVYVPPAPAPHVVSDNGSVRFTDSRITNVAVGTDGT